MFIVSSEGLLSLPVSVAESVCPCAATCLCLLCVISGSVLHVLSMEQRDCYGDTSALYLRVPLVHNNKRDANYPLSTPNEYNSQIMLMLLLLFIKTKIPLYFVKKREKMQQLLKIHIFVTVDRNMLSFSISGKVEVFL